jgi:hypothetical protein
MNGILLSSVCILLAVLAAVGVYVWRMIRSRSEADDRAALAVLRASDIGVENDYQVDIEHIMDRRTASARLAAALELHKRREADRRAKPPCPGPCGKPG